MILYLDRYTAALDHYIVVNVTVCTNCHIANYLCCGGQFEPRDELSVSAHYA